MKSYVKKSQNGFTLIELIVVIVILGVLSATALPRFTNLSLDARLAALKGAAASVSSAAALAHSQQLIANAASNVSVTMDGATVTMAGGYPDVAGIQTAAQLAATDFTLTAGATLTVSPLGAGTPASCQFVYTPSTGKVTGIPTTNAGC